MLSELTSAALLGVEAVPVRVEVDISPGLPGYSVVGLPGESIRESRERIRAAIVNCGTSFPPRRITINLAPADVRKEGSSFDLPIALGILASQGTIPPERLAGFMVAGELSLTGEVRPVRGVLPMAVAAGSGRRGFVLPRTQAAQAGVVRGLRVVPVASLREAIAFFREGEEPCPVETGVGKESSSHACPDLSEVRGQALAKRALEVAAAGWHNILMVGPPGSGKTMLSRRLPGILPPLTGEEALAATCIHSVAGTLPSGLGLLSDPPFRSPHHTVSYAGLVGGGPRTRPGEISLAHNGILFLDELPEFSRRALETLRQPLEEGSVTVARAGGSQTYPARFMLVAAMNPCPCGYLTDPTRECSCPPGQVRRYRSRVSGPLLDRIDIHLEVPPVEASELFGTESEDSASVRSRVVRAREIQAGRSRGEGSPWNGCMTSRAVRERCGLSDEGRRLLSAAMGRLGFSARSYGKILRLARTIADLEGAPEIGTAHLAEAIQYRSLDRSPSPGSMLTDGL